MDKAALRRLMRAKKEALTPDMIRDASARLANMLYATDEYRSADSIYVYLSFNQEVLTRPVIERAWADGKRVAAPKIVSGDMRFVWLDGFDGIVTGRMGVPEPAAPEPAADDEHALVLLPGLAFDREGRRVGYGGGFYDRYLDAHRRHSLVALCYGFQLFERLEAEAHDVPAQLVLSTPVP